MYQPLTTACRYRKLAHDIHEYVFGEISRAAVDAFFDHLLLALQTTGPDQTMRHLIDLREAPGLQPMAHVSQRVSRVGLLSMSHPRTRIALLGGAVSTLTVVGKLIEMYSRDTLDQARSFDNDERELALDWLQLDG